MAKEAQPVEIKQALLALTSKGEVVDLTDVKQAAELREDPAVVLRGLTLPDGKTQLEVTWKSGLKPRDFVDKVKSFCETLDPTNPGPVVYNVSRTVESERLLPGSSVASDNSEPTSISVLTKQGIFSLMRSKTSNESTVSILMPVNGQANQLSRFIATNSLSKDGITERSVSRLFQTLEAKRLTSLPAAA